MLPLTTSSSQLRGGMKVSSLSLLRLRRGAVLRLSASLVRGRRRGLRTLDRRARGSGVCVSDMLAATRVMRC